MLTNFAPAKVNLWLHVTGKRPDGYHLLDSLAVFPNIGDTLSVEPADTLGLTINGQFGAKLAAEPDNLILRAARALHPGGTGHLTLTKNLPVASGIGGGSADAAAALRLLARFWNLTADLRAISATLGADVPVCLARQSTIMQGIGEILLPAPKLPSFGIMLVNPGIPVATAAVFSARHAAFSPAAKPPAIFPTTEDFTSFLTLQTNDLESPALTIAPEIGNTLQTLRHLPKCLLARMSGSGATCFAIFPTPAHAAAAATYITSPNWWHWAGGLYEPAHTDI